MTDHPLPKPPFTDRDRAAYDWLVTHQRGVQWWVNHETGQVRAMRGGKYTSIVEFAQWLGWEG